MERVSDIRDELRTIDGALRDIADLDHHPRGDVAVIQQAIGTLREAEALAFDERAGSPGFDPLDPESEDIVGDPQIVVEFPPDIELDDARPLISLEKANEIASRVSVHGTEALGWYVTFHQTSYQWGAYLSAPGILWLADHGAFDTLQVPRARRIELACNAILRHELMHFAVDYMASQWELAVGIQCYWSSRRLRDPHYGYYLREEELANAYMLRGFRFPSRTTRETGAFHALRDFTLRMPPGYSDAASAVSRSSFEANLWVISAEFEGSIARSYKTCFPEGFDHLSLYPSIRPIDWRYCTILLDHDGEVVPFSVRIILSIAMIEESRLFQRRIGQMGAQVHKAWERTKSKLNNSTQISSLDFKVWAPDVFSVRVTDSIRAHLRLIRNRGAWIAESIGQHKEMGHG